MNQQQWAAALLQRLNVRPTPGAMQAIVGWTQAEGGHWHNNARYNPLNTTQPEPGAGNTGTQGNIKVYKSWDQGLNATVQTLKNGRYGNILSSLHAGNPTAVGRAIEQSPWGTGGLAAKTIAATRGVRAVQVPYVPASPKAAQLYGSSPSSREQIALSLLGMGSLGGYGGGDNLTTSLLAAVQKAKAQPESAPAAYGNSPSPVPGTMPSGITTFDGKPVAAWIKPLLVKARQMGWKGQVNSGYRSFADQTRIYNSGVRPAAKPGTSNHEGSQYPRGAIDVTDAPQLAAILQRIHAPLKWAGAKDRVHFSVPHNGSY